MHREISDILQLDEFRAACRRVIVDFADDHRPDRRGAVVSAGRGGHHLREIGPVGRNGALNVTAKGNIRRGSAKIGVLPVTGHVASAVVVGQVNIGAVDLIQIERRVHARIGCVSKAALGIKYDVCVGL